MYNAIYSKEPRGECIPDTLGDFRELKGQATMNSRVLSWLGLLAAFCLSSVHLGEARAGQYNNFRVAVHIPAGVVDKMRTPLASEFVGDNQQPVESG